MHNTHECRVRKKSLTCFLTWGADMSSWKRTMWLYGMNWIPSYYQLGMCSNLSLDRHTKGRMKWRIKASSAHEKKNSLTVSNSSLPESPHDWTTPNKNKSKDKTRAVKSRRRRKVRWGLFYPMLVFSSHGLPAGLLGMHHRCNESIGGVDGVHACVVDDANALTA